MPKTRLELLEEFFATVADLTSNHDGIHFRVTNDHEDQIEYDVAVVYPSKLGPALEKVDPEWWKLTKGYRDAQAAIAAEDGADYGTGGTPV